jgi:cytosine/adenosine deaminase-related metal-dependent hydrolase
MQLIAPRVVVTADPHTSEVSVTEGVVVVVESGRILEVLSADEAAQKHSGVALESFPTSILTAGFVNSHHHVGVTPFQLGVPDSSLETWIAERTGSPWIDLDIDTRFSAAEMIQSGVTAVQHVQAWYPTDATDISQSGVNVLDAYLEVGLRASFSKMVRTQMLLIHGQDEALASHLPSQHRAEFARQVAGLSVPLNEQIDSFKELRSRYSDQGRVRVQLAPGNLHWVSDDDIRALVALSEEHDVPLHMHLLETPYQDRYMDLRTSGRRLEHLHDLGLLKSRLTLGHGTWLQGTDFEMLAASGVSVCHNCSSNFRLSSGRMPIHDLLERNVNVAVGIDEAGINDDRDMLQELRLIHTVNREPGISGRRVSAEQVFAMATVGGARTMGFGEGHGSITAGAPADLVLFDENVLRGPFQLDGVSVVELLIQRARTAAVTHVMIDGKWVLSDGRLTTIDIDELNSRLSAAMNALDDEKLKESRSFAAALKHAVSDWFVSEYGF